MHHGKQRLANQEGDVHQNVPGQYKDLKNKNNLRGHFGNGRLFLLKAPSSYTYRIDNWFAHAWRIVHFIVNFRVWAIILKIKNKFLQKKN